jgi:hypothetical protein
MKTRISYSRFDFVVVSNGFQLSKEELWKLKYLTMQKNNLQKNPLKETTILQYIIITLKLISSFNTSQKNLIFQTSTYKNRPNLGAKIP